MPCLNLYSLIDRKCIYMSDVPYRQYHNIYTVDHYFDECNDEFIRIGFISGHEQPIDPWGLKYCLYPRSKKSFIVFSDITTYTENYYNTHDIPPLLDEESINEVRRSDIGTKEISSRLYCEIVKAIRFIEKILYSKIELINKYSGKYTLNDLNIECDTEEISFHFNESHLSSVISTGDETKLVISINGVNPITVDINFDINSIKQMNKSSLDDVLALMDNYEQSFYWHINQIHREFYASTIVKSARK